MLTLQVLPTVTFSVKVSVCSLIGPESTLNPTICVRAGGVRSAIGAGFKLLLAGQPFGVADVAAMPTAATAASASTVTAAITAYRSCGYQGNRSTVSPLRQLTRATLTLRRSISKASSHRIA